MLINTSAFRVVFFFDSYATRALRVVLLALRMLLLLLVLRMLLVLVVLLV